MSNYQTYTPPSVANGTVPEGKIVVSGGAGGSSRKAYHTRVCRNVERMSGPKLRAESFADWADLEECSICKTERGKE